MIEITRRDLSDHHQIQAPITKNQLETIGMMSHFTEQFGMDYFEVFDYRYEAQPGNYFLFPWEGEGSAENRIRRG